MKYLLTSVFYATMLFMVFSCSTESVENPEINSNSFFEQQQNLSPEMNCAGQNPMARLRNNGTVNVDLEIYDEDNALLVHYYGIHPGQTTNWTYFPAGSIKFVVSSNTAFKEVVLEMDTCMAYDMEIGPNNQLESDQPIQL